MDYLKVLIAEFIYLFIYFFLYFFLRSDSGIFYTWNVDGFTRIPLVARDATINK